MATEYDPLALEPAAEHAGALACLERDELIAAVAPGPIGSQCRMGGAGHRVLVNAEVRHEHAADHVVRGAGRGDHGHPVNGSQRCEIWLDGADRRLVRKLDYGGVVAA